MATPSPLSIRSADCPRLARKLRRLLRQLERENVDLVPLVILGPEGNPRVVLMYADDCGWLRRPS